MDRDIALNLKTALNNLKTNLQTIETNSYPTTPTENRNIDVSEIRNMDNEDSLPEVEEETNKSK